MLSIKDVKVFKLAVDTLWNEFSKQEYERAVERIVGAYHQISPGHQKMVDEGLLVKVRVQYVERMVERDVWRYPDGVMILEDEYDNLTYDERRRFDEAHQKDGKREEIVTIKYPQKVKQNVWKVDREKLARVIEEIKREAAEL